MANKQADDDSEVQHEIHKYFAQWEECTACIAQTYKTLEQYGFNNTNTIPCVSLCRDELTGELMDIIDEQWRSAEKYTQSFVMSCLAAQMFMGKSGLAAATHHAPKDPKDGKERFVFYLFPHIGCMFAYCAKFVLDSKSHHIGKFNRPGMTVESTACGALMGFLNELKHGAINVALDPLDMEQSLLKQKLIQRITFGKVPNLLELTTLAHKTGLADLEQLINLVVLQNPEKPKVDYAVITGVQIHTPTGDFLWLDDVNGCYCVVDGQKKALACCQGENVAQ